VPERVKETETGNGWAVSSIDGLGEGFGFRKIRKELGVNEMGINVIVIPPNYDAASHSHERQEEVYVVLDGEIEMTFEGEEVRHLGTGGLARVDAKTRRRIRNLSDQPATYLCVGAEGGYVGRDGVAYDDRAGFIADDGAAEPAAG
jgi:mannose-6-phosphate isomerase-like protein (cupin superfamily)